MTDVDKINLAIALAIMFVAGAFALAVVLKRLAVAEQKPLLESPPALGPIGFVHF